MRLYRCIKIICKVVLYYLSNALDKIVVQCSIFEFTINRWTCNAQLLYDTTNGNTTVFDGFLQYFALMGHERVV